MPDTRDRTLYVVEAARRRVVASARDAGRARAVAAVLLFGRASAPERDQLVVREPEEEERAAFKERQFASGGPVTLSAMTL
ncbi:MAG TPA: hypothetical protein VD978_08405 [Azospirillum sp.]|nr:hypothetical protein [Azospirillum sp.]